MTRYDSEYTKEVLSHVLDEKCQAFVLRQRELTLYFGAVIEPAPLKTTWNLWVGCRWRLDDGRRVLSARFDDAELASPRLTKLIGAFLTDVQHENLSHDLKLKFSNGLRIQVFTDSIRYGQWELDGSNGYQYGIGPDLTPYEKMERGIGQDQE